MTWQETKPWTKTDTTVVKGNNTWHRHMANKRA